MQVGDYCDSPLQLQGIRKRLDRKHSSHRPTNDICPSCFLSGKTIFENEKRLKGKLNSPRFGNLPTDSDCSVTIIATCPWGPKDIFAYVLHHWDDFSCVSDGKQ
nr:unnamed protein product [Callosobruchus chinensis]